LAQVHFDAADPTDTLDARQLGLAFLQGAVRTVALAGNFFEVLPQPFRGCRFGEGTVVGGTHLRLL
jgi:hypothetical protein